MKIQSPTIVKTYQLVNQIKGLQLMVNLYDELSDDEIVSIAEQIFEDYGDLNFLAKLIDALKMQKKL
jgi:hypothetical protein